MEKARNNASTFLLLGPLRPLLTFSQKWLIVILANNHEELMGMGFHSIINSQLGKPVSLPQSVQELDDGGIACCEGHKTYHCNVLTYWGILIFAARPVIYMPVTTTITTQCLIMLNDDGDSMISLVVQVVAAAVMVVVIIKYCYYYRHCFYFSM